MKRCVSTCNEQLLIDRERTLALVNILEIEGNQENENGQGPENG